MAQAPGAPAKYLGGFAAHKAKLLGGLWSLRVDDAGFHVWEMTTKGSLVARWLEIRSEPWTKMVGLTFATGDSTSANIPALAVFGVLGLAARRGPGTLVCAAFPDGKVFFKMNAQMFLVQQELDEAITDRRAREVITFDGVPLNGGPDHSTGAPMRSSADAIRDLAALRSEGLISDEEYETKRQALLDRM